MDTDLKWKKREGVEEAFQKAKEVPLPTVPKTTVLSSLTIKVKSDGTYEADGTGDADLILCICVANELQNILGKIHAALMQQRDRALQQALQQLPVGGPQ